MFPCVQHHLSFPFTHIHLLLPSFGFQHISDAANHSSAVSDLYFNPPIFSKIFISSFFSNPLTSQEVRETTYKSDPRPLRLMEKRWDVLPSLFFAELLLPSSTKIHPASSLCLPFTSYHYRLIIMGKAARLLR